MARAPSQGADPSTGNKQRAPTQEPALVKVKRVLPWCPCLFLSCLGFPFVCAGIFFFLVSGCLVSCSVPVFFGLLWPWASRSSSRVGGTSGQFSFPFLLMGSDPSTGFSRYPFMYVLLVFRLVLELVFLVSSTGFFFFTSAVTGHFVYELNLASTKGSEVSISCLVLQTLALCSRSLSQVVSHSTFYATTAILTMINETWVANLAIFQRRWRLPHSCFVDRLGWIAEEDSVAIFVVLMIYNEDEPMFRDTLRTSPLVFIAESDPFCAMHSRFGLGLAGSEDSAVNTKPRMAPSVFPALNT